MGRCGSGNAECGMGRREMGSTGERATGRGGDWGIKRRTSNIERPTSNVEWEKFKKQRKVACVGTIDPELTAKGLCRVELGPGVVLLIAELCRGYRCGLRPVGAIGAYGPEGRGNGESGIRKGEGGMNKA